MPASSVRLAEESPLLHGFTSVELDASCTVQASYLLPCQLYADQQDKSATAHKSSLVGSKSIACLPQGTIEGHEHSYQLDDHHTFVTGKPMLVCGNTAAMVGEGGHSWLAKHFQAWCYCLCCTHIAHRNGMTLVTAHMTASQ